MVNLRRIFLKSLLAIVAVRSFSGFTDLSHSPGPSWFPSSFPLPARSCTRSIFSICSSGLVSEITGSWLLKGATRTPEWRKAKRNRYSAGEIAKRNKRRNSDAETIQEMCEKSHFSFLLNIYSEDLNSVVVK